MIIREKDKNIILFNLNKYTNEEDKYKQLWKLKYNINFPKKPFNEDLLNYIMGIKNHV
tara:strand:+ start:1174 stop:1347 length:174 start_codon:yes stop_codon:yes gene_type:complete